MIDEQRGVWGVCEAPGPCLRPFRSEALRVDDAVTRGKAWRDASWEMQDAGGPGRLASG